MKRIYTFLSFLCGFFLMFTITATAQNHWPKVVSTSDQDQVKIYQWEPETLNGNTLKAKAAISIEQKGKSDLTFGMVWLTANVTKNNDQVAVQSAQITKIKLPGVEETQLNNIQSSLESAISQWNLSFSPSELQQDIKTQQQQKNLSNNFNNTPPKVIYTNRPSLLVYIDGTPRLQKNEDWGVEAVVNSPYTIVRNNDGQFYLYGGNHWYTAPSATGSYRYIRSVPENLAKIEAAVDEANKKNNDNGDNDNVNDNIIPNIIVSTEPAELIQSDGEANFSPIANTGLLYVSNSANDIFMDINSQQYFVLLSGRWYHAKALTGQWQYIASDKLPEDFAKIPESSGKANVLSSVAGTDEAQEALTDAQVPQTAKVDRNNAGANVTYNGDPKFEDIEGTDLEYATNTQSSIIRWKGRYYAVDNGVWFESRYASGPWAVSIERPYSVAYIPARYPVYNVKYVYIYDVYPDYVYMGYTPGYLNTFIYGPTIVYGTGYYYSPWYDDYYYPRPCTWGFGMRYNPWIGWGFGLNISFGWFNYGYGSWPYSWGGWWGPSIYRPSYCWSGYRGSPYRGVYDYYGGNYGYRNRNYAYSNYRTNNVYRDRTGVVTRDNLGRYNRPYRANNNERPGWADNNRNNIRPSVRDRNNNNNNYNYNNNRFNNSNSDRPTRQYRGFNGTTTDNNRSNNGNNNRQLQRPSYNGNSSGSTRERITREPRDYGNNGNRTPRFEPPARQERGGGGGNIERPRANRTENNNSRPGGRSNEGSNSGRRGRG